MDIKRNKQIGTVLAVVSFLSFFALLANKESIDGLLVLSYPIAVLCGLFFSALGASGKILDSLKYFGFIVAFSLILLSLGFLFRR
jgi:hypothetical protein